jgi:DnaJ-class molecular chaperone
MTLIPCQFCNGQGEVIVIGPDTPIPHTMESGTPTTCDQCNGSGQMEACPSCGGKGFILGGDVPGPIYGEPADCPHCHGTGQFGGMR